MFSSSSLERAFCRSSVLLGYRPEASSSWLERAFLRSSEAFLCLVARATNPSLERACFISVGSSGENFTFSSPSLFQTLDLRPSLSRLAFSLRNHLLLVWIYPWCFVKKVESVESFDLIWKSLGLEHVGFWSSSPLWLKLRGRDTLLLFMSFVFKF